MNSLTNRLRVAALPLPIVSADTDANLAVLRERFKNLPVSTDVVVLPELFSTGFHPKMDMSRLAEPSDGKTIQTVRSLSFQYGVAIAGSFLAAENSRYYNRGFFVEPSGEIAWYDKHHLFSSSAESEILSGGVAPKPVIRFRGWNISMVICYDLRFPAWCRNTKGSYDLLLIPANWPSERGYAWRQLLIARAIENQAAVVGANRGGQDKFGTYDDETYIFDCMGKSVGKVEGAYVVADLDKDFQNKYRTGFPAQEEADSFLFL